MRSPRFWYPGQDNTPVMAHLLSPLGLLCDTAGRLYRKVMIPERLGIPVFCVGNVTAGGTGKTPVCLALAKILLSLGETPHFISRGYGGSLKGPVQIIPEHHSYEEAGDEALLLARLAPVWVCGNRAASGQKAEAAGASVIIMDDGFQNPSLYKDFSILLFDGKRGVGNGHVIPAGPLRENLERALERSHVLVTMNAPLDKALRDKVRAGGKNILEGRLIPGTGFQMHQPAYAFSGIGNPEKFTTTLRSAGITIAGTQSFGDHHRYTVHDVQKLQKTARNLHAQLVTTEKDYIRLAASSSPALRVAARNIMPLPVEAHFTDGDRLRQCLKTLLADCRAQGKYIPF